MASSPPLKSKCLFLFRIFFGYDKAEDLKHEENTKRKLKQRLQNRDTESSYFFRRNTEERETYVAESEDIRNSESFQPKKQLKILKNKRQLTKTELVDHFVELKSFLAIHIPEFRFNDGETNTLETDVTQLIAYIWNPQIPKCNKRKDCYK